MKRCTHCGKEYPDNTNFCPIDGHPVVDPAHPPSAIPPPVLLKSAIQTPTDPSKPAEVPKPPADAPKKAAEIRKPAELPKKSATGRYLQYKDVPWYRREPGPLAMIGVLCGVLSVPLCILCFTGDIYKKRFDRKGNLVVWGTSNKIAAVVVLVIQGFILWLCYWQ
jgi:zinc-ribbon domain